MLSHAGMTVSFAGCSLEAMLRSTRLPGPVKVCRQRRLIQLQLRNAPQCRRVCQEAVPCGIPLPESVQRCISGFCSRLRGLHSNKLQCRGPSSKHKFSPFSAIPQPSAEQAGVMPSGGGGMLGGTQKPAVQVFAGFAPMPTPRLRSTVESVRSRCQRLMGSFEDRCSSSALAMPRLPSEFSKSIGFT